MVSTEHHAGRGLVGELRLVDRAERLVEATEPSRSATGRFTKIIWACGFPL